MRTKGVCNQHSEAPHHRPPPPAQSGISVVILRVRLKLVSNAEVSRNRMAKGRVGNAHDPAVGAFGDAPARDGLPEDDAAVLAHVAGATSSAHAVATSAAATAAKPASAAATAATVAMHSPSGPANAEAPASLQMSCARAFRMHVAKR